MRNYLFIATLTLFCLGLGTGYNFTENHWTQLCDSESRSLRVLETRDSQFHQNPELTLKELQSLEGCSQPNVEEEILKAAASYSSGDWKRTEFYATRALGLQSQSGEAYELRGKSRFHQRRFILALEDIEAALKNAPSNPEALKLRSVILDQLGMQESASESITDSRTPASAPHATIDIDL